MPVTSIYIQLLFCCLVLLSDQAVAENLNSQLPASSPTFELTDQKVQHIDEMLIWRALDNHQTPLNFAAIQQLLPQSTAINKSILGSSGAYLAKIPLRNTKYLTSTWYINPHTNFVDKGIAFWQQSDGNVIKLADFLSI